MSSTGNCSPLMYYCSTMPSKFKDHGPHIYVLFLKIWNELTIRSFCQYAWAELL